MEWKREMKTRGANKETSVGCPPLPPQKKREPQGHPITHVNETTLRHPSYFRIKALLEAFLCPRWLPKGNLGKGAQKGLIRGKALLRSNPYQSASLALMNSRLRRAILDMLSHLGHTASQARVLVQLPNPSSSILATIALARLAASTCP